MIQIFALVWSSLHILVGHTGDQRCMSLYRGFLHVEIPYVADYRQRLVSVTDKTQAFSPHLSTLYSNLLLLVGVTKSHHIQLSKYMCVNSTLLHMSVIFNNLALLMSLEKRVECWRYLKVRQLKNFDVSEASACVGKCCYTLCSVSLRQCSLSP